MRTHGDDREPWRFVEQESNRSSNRSFRKMNPAERGLLGCPGSNECSLNSGCSHGVKSKGERWDMLWGKKQKKQKDMTDGLS